MCQDIPVEVEYIKVVEELQRKRQFRALQGPILRSGNTSQDLGSRGVDPNTVNDPLLLLREHIVVNDTRIIDMLRSRDKTQTMSVTMDQFEEALQVESASYNSYHEARSL